jgi:hypothetical protein
VGIIGLALPIALLVGKPLVDGGDMLGSISAYYYTEMRNYFVGTLCALAVFLFSYRYAPRDNFLSTLASLFALGVVFFPTTPSDCALNWPKSGLRRWAGVSIAAVVRVMVVG